MKWSILRLIEAPLSERERRARPARALVLREPSQPVPESRLPHRGVALRALRQLARGHYLVIGGETALAVNLAGVPDVVHLSEDLIQRGLVDRVHVPGCGGACYTLSKAGRDALRRGEEWWSELSMVERLVAEFTG